VQFELTDSQEICRRQRRNLLKKSSFDLAWSWTGREIPKALFEKAVARFVASLPRISWSIARAPGKCCCDRGVLQERFRHGHGDGTGAGSG